MMSPRSARCHDNEGSVVLLALYSGWRILLTGDIETVAMQRLMDEHRDSLNADIVVLPHHGTAADGIEEFLRTVRPRVALASTGEPLSERMKRILSRLDIPLWSTAEEGAIVTQIEPEEVHIRGYASGRYTTLTR